jgi:hypothetical protein
MVAPSSSVSTASVIEAKFHSPMSIQFLSQNISVKSVVLLSFYPLLNIHSMERGFIPHHGVYYPVQDSHHLVKFQLEAPSTLHLKSQTRVFTLLNVGPHLLVVR